MYMRILIIYKFKFVQEYFIFKCNFIIIKPFNHYQNINYLKLNNNNFLII